MIRKWKEGVQIKVNLEFDAGKAEILETSLRPDNQDIPSELFINQYVKQDTLTIIFDSKRENVETLLSTVDEVLSIADGFINTINEV